ncbi:MAG: sel1 repeat family protein [Syntrophorhabdaceae bacterium]|nr:sel1 repeat family protein [Syntrophorhabdaceae bacterium]
MYYSGRGVAQNYVEAVKWYRLAAEQGNAKAQYNLGAAYVNGHGVAQDYTEAEKWLRLAAEQGGEVGKRAQDALKAKPLF